MDFSMEELSWLITGLDELPPALNDRDRSIINQLRGRLVTQLIEQPLTAEEARAADALSPPSPAPEPG
jgi:hypothetical protein